MEERVEESEEGSMKKKMQRIIVGLLAVSLLAGSVLTGVSVARQGVEAKAASADSTITMKQYLNKIMPLYGVDAVDGLSAAYYNNVITIDDFEIADEPIKRGKAAVIAKKVYQAKYGESYNKKKYKAVVEEKRITGLGNNTKEERGAVRLCYVYGLMTGKSKGLYTNSRSIKGDEALTKKEANAIVRRIADKGKCKKITPDGRLIRTTNLPSNYKKFNYILASYPNKFYEKNFRYQNITYYYEPEEGVHYASPKALLKYDYYVNSINEYRDDAMERLQKNLDLRLNFDYRTVNSGWVHELKNTYVQKGNAQDVNLDDLEEDINAWVKKAKASRLIIESEEVVADPTTVYLGGHCINVRCHAKVKIQARDIPAVLTDGHKNLIYSWEGTTYLPGLKNNEWYDLVFDFGFYKGIGPGWTMECDALGYNP